MSSFSIQLSRVFFAIFSSLAAVLLFSPRSANCFSTSARGAWYRDSIFSFFECAIGGNGPNPYERRNNYISSGPNIRRKFS